MSNLAAILIYALLFTHIFRTLLWLNYAHELD